MTVVLLTCLSMLCDAVFVPKKTDAAVLTLTAAGLIETFIMSAGATALTVKGLEGLKTAYDEYIGGTAAEQLEDVATEQIYLYSSNEPESSPDPDVSPSPDIADQVKGIYLTQKLFNYAKDFFQDFFGKEPEVPSSNYLVFNATEALSKINFGYSPQYDFLERWYDDTGYDFLNGSFFYDNGSKLYSIKYVHVDGDYGPFLYVRNSSSERVDVKLAQAAPGNNNLGDIADNGVYCITFNNKGELDGTSLVSRRGFSNCVVSSVNRSVYYSIPGTTIYDVSKGMNFYWSGSKMYRIISNSDGTYTYVDVNAPYVHCLDGYYNSVTDVYNDSDALTMINDRLDRIENYVRTEFPDEFPQIDYSELEVVQPNIQEIQTNYVAQYPMQQPDSLEVPSQYSDELDDVWQDAISNSNPDLAPDAAPGGNPSGTSAPDDDTSPGGSFEQPGDYALNLSDFFPFCIPSDIYMLFKGFAAEPESPSFELTLPTVSRSGGVSDNTFTIDLSILDPVASVVRVMEKIAFVFGLVVVTRKVVKGG